MAMVAAVAVRASGDMRHASDRDGDITVAPQERCFVLMR